jgi:hypothetical protein
MELARVLRELWGRKLLMVLGAALAAVASVFSIYHLQGGKLKARSLQYSAASTQVLVDSSSSLLGSAAQVTEPLSVRARVFANLMASPALLESTARLVGLTGGELYAAGPVNANEPRVEQEPTDLKRNVQITGETKPYRLNFESQQELPTITIYSQAPSTRLAINLANAAATTLQQYVAHEETSAKVPPNARVVIRRLGVADGAIVNGGISKTLAAIVFVAVFLLWCLLVLLGVRFRESWSAVSVEEASLRPRPEAEPTSGEEGLRHGRINGDDADEYYEADGSLDDPRQRHAAPSVR